jgi:hypothetical protein
MTEYPITAEDCEDIFMEGDFELTCGKRNVYGEWILCPNCSKLESNFKFIKKVER